MMRTRLVDIPRLGEKICSLESRRLDILKEQENLLSQRNSLSKKIGGMKGQKADQLKSEVIEIKARLEVLNNSMKDVSSELEDILMNLPNVAREDVPLGEDEESNEEMSREGEVDSSDNSKEHFTIAESLSGGEMDFEIAAVLSGARFVLLSGVLARLERAITQMMLDLHTTEHGYKEMSVPLMVLPKILEGTGQLPKFREDLFQINSAAGHYLIPTAEVPLSNLVRDKISSREQFPMRVTSLTQCFRKEAGAAGKDTRGMLRQHQFSKVELVSITLAEDSESEHARMTECAKQVLRRLDLPFREVKLSRGDMGFSAMRTIDLEVWLPGQKTYREISSCSTCGDFQARRMGARVKRSQGKGSEFLHTLNGSGVAVGRALIAVLENGYRPDTGVVVLPKALIDYMGGMDVLELKM